MAAYVVWTPGKDIRDGRHDLGANAIWLEHGWLGDDLWFRREGKTDLIPRFHDPERIAELAALLREHHITDVYPHLCPAQPDGALPGVDAGQVERFLDAFEGFRVMPWIGGPAAFDEFPSAQWRGVFVQNVRELLVSHPRLAGIHINIEPCRSGNPNFLALLDELRAVLPGGKLLSVAAYPPPTRWQPSADVHWNRDYYRAVAQRADQLVVMMYDTGIRHSKFYQQLVASWTRRVLAWSGDSSVLLGLPAYEDAGVGYHHPGVENLRNALLGIHAGLAACAPFPTTYRGIAIYSEWEMDKAEWRLLRERFLTQD
ncbi:MAG: hypothetical protein JW889_13715 [Verrucomicrobia bacterium]|nr:hypothetical protein [Verrucomicrobiota bacterium]